jgi:hypothetical protein
MDKPRARHKDSNASPSRPPKPAPEGDPKPVQQGDTKSPEEANQDAAAKPAEKPAAPRPDPTRYGDWEKNGRCIDF